MSNFAKRKYKNTHFFGTLPVYIANEQRINDSNWFKKKIIYHEYGHVIDNQRGLRQSDEVQKLMKKHKDLLLNTEVVIRRDSKGIPTKTISLAEDLYNRMKKENSALEELINQRSGAGLSTKEYKDIQEQLTSTADTILALTKKYGWGHTPTYFQNESKRIAEYIAHAFENAFMGNEKFRELLPEIYDDIVDYIKGLKKYNS